MLYTDFQLDSAVDSGAQYALNNAAMVGSNPATLSSNVSSIVNNLNGAREGLNKGAAGRYRLLTLQQPVRGAGIGGAIIGVAPSAPAAAGRSQADYTTS